ncbi:TPA: hypothetical protein ACH3X1_002332 [Trebouxia sp. C0004]
MAPKRKAEKGESSGTPGKKSRAKKEKPLAEPHTGDDGWTIVPPSLLFKHADLKHSSKIAAFDLVSCLSLCYVEQLKDSHSGQYGNKAYLLQDGTLVGTKGKAVFPIDEHDWRFFSKHVPKELQAFHEKGFKIVIFR